MFVCSITEYTVSRLVAPTHALKKWVVAIAPPPSANLPQFTESLNHLRDLTDLSLILLSGVRQMELNPTPTLTLTAQEDADLCDSDLQLYKDHHSSHTITPSVHSLSG